jgi:dTDP-4-amino-4,6-dideoxygalactose transaminase
MTSPVVPSAGPIPLFDLACQHRAIAADARAMLERVAASGRFVLGEELAAFEAEFAAYCGVRHCVGVASGTDARVLALRAAGIGPGARPCGRRALGR